jgi:hypothetical protein
MNEQKLPESLEYAFVHIPKNAGCSIQNAVKDIPNIQHYGHGVQFSKIHHLKKIMVVREPISRFTSAFFYLKTYKKNRENNFFQTPKELVDGMLEFDIRAFNFLKVHDGDHHVNGNRINTDWVFNKQIDWIIDPFKILVYERLDHDIEKLNDETQLGIRLAKVNQSKKVDFEYSDDNIKYLNLIYKKDFEMYNKYV